MHKYVVCAHAQDPVARAAEITGIIEAQGSRRAALVVDQHTIQGFDQLYDIVAIFDFGERELVPGDKEELDSLLGGVDLALLATVVGDDETELEGGGAMAQS